MVDLSIVVACYNDGAHLEESLREIEKVLEQTRYSYEFIIIDDASPDGSAEAVKRAVFKRQNARCILHAQNVGRGGTVAEGFRMADGRLAGFLDIDLEVHCRYLPSMLLALEDGCDAAVAQRHYEIHWSLDTFFRYVLSVGYQRMVHIMLGLPFQDTEAGYKFFHRNRILPLLDEVQSQGWFWDTEIMAQCYYHELEVREIPALFIRRWDKPSTVKPIRDSWRYLVELFRFRSRMRREGVL